MVNSKWQGRAVKPEQQWISVNRSGPFHKQSRTWRRSTIIEPYKVEFSSSSALRIEFVFMQFVIDAAWRDSDQPGGFGLISTGGSKCKG